MREQEVRNLWEAYLEVCENQQLDEARTDPRGRPASGPMSVYGGRGTPSPDPEGDDNISRMDRAQRRVKRTQPRAKGMAADSLFTKYSARQKGMEHGSEEGPGPKAPKRSGRSGRGANTDRGSGNAAKRRMSEDFDLFDTILEHLVAEGYADTNEAALVIMANMSEEWREDIMEISQKTATSAYAKSATGEFEGADSDRDIKRTENLGKHIKRKFGKKASEDADRHADSSTFGRKDPRTGKSQPRPQSRIEKNRTYRTTKAGSMHGQDQAKLKSDLIKSRNKRNNA
jgi:hypothetical protein